MIQRFPQLSATTGDLGRHAIAAWLNLTAGSDGVFRAALEQRLDFLRGRFPVAADDQAGQMVVERILVTWLQLAYADARMGQPENMTHADLEFLARRQQQAQKQHLSAIQAWRQWRRFVTDVPLAPPRSSYIDDQADDVGDAACILPFPRQAATA